MTPNELFYVRNHLPVPDVDLKVYTYMIYVITKPIIHVTTVTNLCFVYIQGHLVAIFEVDKGGLKVYVPVYILYCKWR